MSDQFVGHAIGEVVLILIPGDVLEREHNQRRNSLRIGLAGVDFMNRVCRDAQNQDRTRRDDSCSLDGFLYALRLLIRPRDLRGLS